MSYNWKHPTKVTRIVLNVNQDRIIRVYAKEYYSSSALIVKKGQKYQFKVDDQDFWKDFFICCNAEGFRNILLRKSSKRVRGALCFCLCGTIGMDDEHNFIVGLGIEYHACHTGNLHFFANDKKDSRFANRNNKGFLNVHLRRIE